MSKRTVVKVLKNFIKNCSEDSLSSGSLESTVNASHILNQQILNEVKKLSKSLEALHLPSITQPVFSDDLYVSVTGDETVYHLSTFKGYKQNVVNDEWVACMLSLLSALSCKHKVGLMYLPHVLHLDKALQKDFNIEEKYSLDGCSYVCGVLSFMNRVFYVIGNYQKKVLPKFDGWWFSLLGEGPKKSYNMKTTAEDFLQKIFKESPSVKVNVISHKEYKENKWDQEDTRLWDDFDLGKARPDHGAVPFPYLFPRSFEECSDNEKSMSLKMKDSSQTILHLFRVLKMICDNHKSDSRLGDSSLPHAFTPVTEALSYSNEHSENIVAAVVLDVIAECIVEGDVMVSAQCAPFQALGNDGRIVDELKEMSAQLKGKISHPLNNTKIS